MDAWGGGGAARPGFAMPCPFCGAPAAPPRCATCQRDPTAMRRVCAGCRRQTPTIEPVCMHCQRAPANEMAWKIPVIVLLFVVAFAISVAIALAR